MTLQVGEPATVDIQSRLIWNVTGIEILKGKNYRFTAAGEWMDWYIKYTPDGGPSGANLSLLLTQQWRRRPHEKWFALIGSVDQQDSEAFLIGSSRECEATCDGMLTCYANDVPWAYWNNKGSVRLTVELLPWLTPLPKAPGQPGQARKDRTTSLDGARSSHSAF